MQSMGQRSAAPVASTSARGLRMAFRSRGARLVVRAQVPAFKAAKKPVFPFVKIADQEELKLALTLNVVDPNIGGVLIMGDRGTAKSVSVRAVAELLPDLDVVENDAFNSSPFDPKLMGPDALAKFRKGEPLKATKLRTPLVELPLGATEDRICGTIDINKALTEGVKAYEPGLLAKANRGILYVDEVNLLDDGLVDVVLDSSASGINTVEREGISIVHPAKFIMIGSGNPAEGELRPQLLDRFGLAVQTSTMMDAESRTRMVLDRMAFDADPDAFVASTKEESAALMVKLEQARQRLKSVRMSDKLQLTISDLCARLDVDGLRGDLVTNRTAKALAALEGRTEVTLNDIQRVISMCLNHRLRKDPLDPIDNGTKVAIVWRRLTDPEFIKREQEAEKAKKEAAAAGAKAKKGAWGGLPPRVGA